MSDDRQDKNVVKSFWNCFEPGINLPKNEICQDIQDEKPKISSKTWEIMVLNSKPREIWSFVYI